MAPPPTTAQVAWFDALYRAHRDRVVDYARRRVGDAAAEDVAAEVFAAAWRHRDDPAIDLAWLIRAAAYEVLHEHRGTGRRDRLAVRAAATTTVDRDDPSDHLVDRLDDTATITSALATLSDTDRELLRLLAWDQLTPREIAAVVGCSAVAARVRIHRATRRLARAVDGRPHPTPNVSPARSVS